MGLGREDWLTLSDCLRAQAMPRRIPFALYYFLFLPLYSVACEFCFMVVARNAQAKALFQMYANIQV